MEHRASWLPAQWADVFENTSFRYSPAERPCGPTNNCSDRPFLFMGELVRGGGPRDNIAAHAAAVAALRPRFYIKPIPIQDRGAEEALRENRGSETGGGCSSRPRRSS
eukprot:5332416-Pyramimonas_sp.AAC.1